MKEFFYDHHLAFRRIALLLGLVLVVNGVLDAMNFDARFLVKDNSLPTASHTVAYVERAAVGGFLIAWAVWVRKPKSRRG